MHAMEDVSLTWLVYLWSAFVICSCKTGHRVRNCAEVQEGGATNSGIYTVYLNEQPTQVYCDLNTAGGGWTVLQRRKDGTEDFFRTWAQYKIGFGHPLSEFWLGNEHIHQLTVNSQHILRVDLTAYDGSSRYAEYVNFSLSTEETGYKLHLGNYLESSNAGDSLTYHREMPFATWDRDNNVECAKRRHGAWWYNNCLKSNLNAQHNKTSKWSNVVWQEWRGPESLLSTEMKIRPLYFETGPLHCSDIQDCGATESGIYTIRAGSRTVKVFCDLSTTDGGWTVLHRRTSGSSNFLQTWDEYRHGFGDVRSEFWLGNDNIHEITSTGERFLLRIELISADGEKRIAEYSRFSLDTADSNYRLHIGAYISRSDAGDSLSYHREMPFSTWDKDNSGRTCATKQRGGWWFNKCFHSNLNGLYKEDVAGSGMVWLSWRGYQPLKAAEMKIKRITPDTEALLKVPNVRCPSGSLRAKTVVTDDTPAVGGTTNYHRNLHLNKLHSVKTRTKREEPDKNVSSSSSTQTGLSQDLNVPAVHNTGCGDFLKMANKFAYGGIEQPGVSTLRSCKESWSYFLTGIGFDFSGWHKCYMHVNEDYFNNVYRDRHDVDHQRSSAALSMQPFLT